MDEVPKREPNRTFRSRQRPDDWSKGYVLRSSEQYSGSRANKPAASQIPITNNHTPQNASLQHQPFRSTTKQSGRHAKIRHRVKLPTFKLHKRTPKSYKKKLLFVPAFFVLLLIISLVGTNFINNPQKVEAAIGLRDVASSAQASGTSESLSPGALTKEGDIMIATLHTALAPGTVTATGWTLIGAACTGGTGNSLTTVRSWWRARVAGDTSYSISWTSSVEHKLTMASYSGVNRSTPIHGTAGTCATGTGTALTANNITTSVANTTIIGIWTIGNSNSGTTHNITPTSPGGVTVTERFSNTGNYSYNCGLICTNTAQYDYSFSDSTQAAATNNFSRAASSNVSSAWAGMNFALNPATDPSLEQAAYRWLTNANSITPGAALAATNTAITNVKLGDIVRLRMLLHISTAELQVDLLQYKLKFATKVGGACGGGDETFSDVASGSGTIRYADNAAVADGATIATTANDPSHSGHTIIAHTYEEANNFSTRTLTPSGQDAMWDFALTNNSAPNNTAYCFKITTSADADINTYTVYPEFTTINITYNQAAYRWFNPANSTTPGSALAAGQDTAITQVNTSSDVRLRMLIDNGGTDPIPAAYENLKLQYAVRGVDNSCDTSFTNETYGDIATASGDIRYKDNATPADNATAVTATGDATYLGHTINFQYYKEANNFTTRISQPATQAGLWDFSLTNFSAPFGTVYCFRVVKSDGTAINTYTSVPQLTIINPAFEQAAYRWYDGNNGTSPGTVRAASSTATTGVGTSTQVRLRMLVHISSDSIFSGTETFKLQFATKSGGSCGDDETFGDVATGSGAIRYYDNTTPADAAAISTTGSDPTHSGHTIRTQTYEESNNFTSTTTTASGEDAMWDFSLATVSAPLRTSYCFKIVRSSGSAINTYTVYPELKTTDPQYQESAYRWHDNTGTGGAGGTITHVQSTKSVSVGTVASQSTTFASTPTAGNLVVVACTAISGGTFGTSAVTDNKGNTYTRINTATVLDNTVAVFYAKNISSSATFTVTCDANINDYTAIAIHEYSGADITTPADQTNTGTGTSTAVATANVTTATSNQLYFGAMVYEDDATRTITPGSGYTERQESESSASATIGTEDKTAAAGTHSATWTLGTSGSWAAVIATFKPAAGGGGAAGSPLAANNTPVTDISQNTVVRLRMLIHVSNDTHSAGLESFKLQFAQKVGTCDTAFTGESYNDLDPASGAFRYYDNATLSDGSSISTSAGDPSHSSDTIRTQTYEESNNFTSTAQIAAGEDGMWEFAIVNFSASQNTSWCFRALRSDDTLFDAIGGSYSQIAELNTAPVSFNQSAYRWFQNVNVADMLTITTNPSSGDDAINDTAIDISGGFIYLVGYDSNGTDKQWRIEKRNIADADLVTTFDTDGIVTDDIGSTLDDEAIAIAIDIPNDRMYVVGYETPSAANEQWHIQKRKLSDGSLDTTFDTDGRLTIAPTVGNDRINAVAIDSTYMYLAGYDSTNGDQIRFEKRTLSGGAVDTGFDADTGDTSPAINTDGVYAVNPSSGTRDDRATAIALDSTYLYLVGYDKNPGNDNSEWHIEKMNKSTGVHDDGFDTDGVLIIDQGPNNLIDVPNAVAIDSTYMYVAGNYETSSDKLGWAIGKFSLSSGAGDTAFDGDGGEAPGNGILRFAPSANTDEARDIAIDSTYMYVVGFDETDTDRGWRIEKRSLANGQRDTGFDSDGIIYVNPHATNNDEANSVTVDTTNSRFYTAGFDQTQGSSNREWRIEKRKTTDGSRGWEPPTALVAQDTKLQLASGTKFRLRLAIHISGENLSINAETMKLQYAPKVGTCDAGQVGEVYADVTGSGDISYYDNTNIADSSTTVTIVGDPAHSGHTNIAQTYEEANNFTNPVAISAGQDGLWDFALIENNTAFGNYCFRVIKSDNSPLGAYGVIPEVVFCDRPKTENLLRSGNFFCDDSKQKFYWN
jgi:hypothetical protein